MKNKLFKKIVCLLAGMMTFSCVAACDDGGKDANTTPKAQLLSYTGTHDFTAPETDTDLVKNGQTEYRLVVPATMSSTLKIAKDEFVYLFEKATGIKMLSVVESEQGMLHDSNAKYISLGDTKMATSANLDVDKSTLGYDGVRIITKDKTVYLLGGSDDGATYAVYDFMQIMFDYEVYYKDCFEINENVKNAKLKAFNVTDIPDIPWRLISVGTLYDTSTDYDENLYPTRFRMKYKSEDLIMKTFDLNWIDENDKSKGLDYDVSHYNYNSAGATLHNTTELLPAADYPDHPKWQGDDGLQLCYSAHGDEAELQAMAEEVARKMTISLQVYDPINWPKKNKIAVTVEDGGRFCSCDTCLGLRQQYGGTDAAVVIRFLNKVSKLVKAWMNDPANAAYYREDFKIMFFAYNTLSVAPVKWDASLNKYVPQDETVKMDDGVGVYFAINSHFRYSKSISDEENQMGLDAMKTWTDTCDDIMWWTYGGNYKNFMYFYDQQNFYTSEAYQHIAASNTFALYNQGWTSQRGAVTGWQNLRAYLDYKLQWNSSLDLNTLIDRYFNGMFKEAAPIMKQLYFAQKTHVKYLYDTYPEITASIKDCAFVNYSDSKYWPYATMKDFTLLCDKAMEEIAHYETSDPKLYKALSTHINIEWLSPAFALLKHYQDQMIADELSETKTRFKYWASTLKMLETKEYGKDMEGFLNGL